MWPFHHRPTDAEIARELRDHLSLDAEELAARGAGAAAPHEARRRFGNLALTAEAVRGVWRLAWLEQLVQDIRHGWRGLWHSPVYAITATLTLALGIGASTAVFSLGDPLVHRPFPLLPQDRLVWIVQRSKQCPSCDNASAAAYLALARNERALSAVGAAAHWSATLRGSVGSELVHGYTVTANLFTLVDAPFALGHGFVPGDDEAGASDVTVISYDFWQSRFAGSPRVLDSTIVLNGTAHRVVGVLGRGLAFPTQSDVYAPLVLGADDANDHQSRYLDVFGRLAPGATVRQAQAEAAIVSARLAREAPRSDPEWIVFPRPISEFHGDDVRQLVLPLAVAVALVLLAACVSVANLALARTTARRRELAVRAALGGRRARLARHLVTEALLVALAGGAIGIVLARWGARAMHDTIPASFAAFAPGWASMGIDGRALAFTLVISIGATLVFGALPIVRATRVDLSSVLSDGGRGAAGGRHGTRVRSALVILEVSVAIVLLSGAALLTRSVRNMMAGDPGVRLDHVLTMHYALPAGLSDSASRAAYLRIERQLDQTPGVRAAGFASTTPLSNNFWGTTFAIPGRPPAPNGQQFSANDQLVSPEYMSAMGIRVVRGRGIEARDTYDAPHVAVINQFMADNYWPGHDAVGQQLIIHGMAWTIVGISANVYHGGLDAPLRDEIDRPIQQSPNPAGALEVWTAGDPDAMRAAVRGAIAAADPSVAIGDMMTMRQMESRHVSAFVLMSGVLSVFAAATFVIAIVGLYGVIAYDVVQRTREIGVRLALGAGRRAILAQVTRSALRLATTGAAIGCAGALAFTQLLRAMLYRVTATDPTTPLALAAALLVVAVLAALLPAWRASRVNPVIALRE